jgi:hypothetical protein
VPDSREFWNQNLVNPGSLMILMLGRFREVCSFVIKNLLSAMAHESMHRTLTSSKGLARNSNISQGYRQYRLSPCGEIFTCILYPRRRSAMRCGAERSGATTRPKVFEEQPELKALPLLMKCEKAPPCNPFTRGLSPLNVPN